MVWFASPGARPGAPSFSFGPVKQDATKQPEEVSADRFTVSKVLGRSIPVIIGTGKVDGIPVIGGALTVPGPTSYNQVQIKNYESLGDYPPGSKWLKGDYFSSNGIVLVPVAGAAEQVAALGYLLAYDPFGDGYELVRVEVDDVVVYDAENGVGASVSFRFYGGNHTEVDPITSGVIGANAGAWQNFAMIYLDGYATDSAPSVKCVISNAADVDDAVTEAIEGAYADLNWFETEAAYDVADGLIYQYVSDGGDTLHVLSVDSRAELYQVPWPTSALTSPGSFVVLPGTGFLLASSYQVSASYEVGLINAANGEAVVITAPSGSKDWEAIAWFHAISTSAPGVYLVLGQYLTVHTSSTDDANAAIAVCNTVNGTVEIIDLSVTYDGWSYACRGRVGPGSASFFIVKWDYTSSEFSNATISEIVWQDGLVSVTDIYTVPAGLARGVAYDPMTGYLVIPAVNSGVHSIYIVDPATGVLIRTISTARDFDLNSDYGYYTSNRLFPSFGSVFLIERTDKDVYLLNLSSFALIKYAEYPYTSPELGIYDQSRNSWLAPDGTPWSWTIHKSALATPQSVPLETILTKASFLVGYGPSELTFEGLSGLSGYGLGIYSNTNIRTVIQSVADIYGFSFADTGNGFYFKKPGRDASFALDAALTTADLVFGEDAAVNSKDEATIRTVSRVELEYISREQGYTSRPASFTMPAITNSIRVEQYSTPLVLSDQDAQTFVTEKFFELQARRRAHSFSLTGKPAFLPGDVVSVPSGAITYTVQIDSVSLNRNMVADIEAIDFQTAVSTTITAVTNTGYGAVLAVTFATQYIHLDVPLFQYSDDVAGAGLVQYGVVASRGQANWAGGILYRGNVTSDLGAQATQAPHDGVIGICTTVLAAPGEFFVTDDVSTVTVRITSGDATLFVDASASQVLLGANNAFIGKDGRWEWVGYRTAVDNGDGTFTLSGFTVRGRRGSEVHCGSHAVGDSFVMISSAWLTKLSHPLSDLDATLYYRAIGAGADQFSGAVLPHVVTGTAETPYAAVNVAGALDGGDTLISFDRRSRLRPWEMFAVSPDNGEATQSFEVDVYDGVDVVRTITATSLPVTYLAADKVTDFGTPPAEADIKVYQMSATVGRGYAADATIPL
ncbi:phage tail protein [Mesorhizobium sp. M6A.T.Ce.TU.016.01.1.1]|uniref:phage tail protein n=1 Tax=Mesorhizobium sp. M6A.T.Ce.TU.016.01.1.1 TaxID=2496783 RepID=UPI000FCB7C85|nr:phage tail protein [Mesorhizobium sp. M6A.T.Ce.TU.016.01.1.1]RUU29772.1 hypothetical protein EOC94_12965 [Mesorhizobium sp. M6A.T.Ce.TU.016.01.1.1]